jgi:hypothetical protein
MALIDDEASHGKPLKAKKQREFRGRKFMWTQNIAPLDERLYLPDPEAAFAVIWEEMKKRVPDIRYMCGSLERGDNKRKPKEAGSGPPPAAADISSESSSARQAPEELDAAAAEPPPLGNLHWQMYGETEDQHSVPALLAPKKGSVHISLVGLVNNIQACYAPQSAKNYACKEDHTFVAGPFEIGSQKQQGQQSGLNAAVAAIEAGNTLRSLRDSGEHHLVAARFPQYLMRRQLDVWDSTRRPVEWPVQFAGLTMNKPDPTMKKRHLWVVAPASWGKTLKMQETFQGQKKCVFTGHNPNRWEKYNDEDLIIYDDCPNIPFNEFSQVTNTSDEPQMLSNGRYSGIYLAPNSARNCIVLTQKSIQQYGFIGEDLEGMLERFIICDFRKREAPIELQHPWMGYGQRGDFRSQQQQHQTAQQQPQDPK